MWPVCPFRLSDHPAIAQPRFLGRHLEARRFEARRFEVYTRLVNDMNITSFENRVIDLCSRAVKAEDDEEVQQTRGRVKTDPS